MLGMFTPEYTGQKIFDQSEIRLLLESDKMRGVTKLKSKPKIAVKFLVISRSFRSHTVSLHV